MDKFTRPAAVRLGPAPGLTARLFPARRPLDGDRRALLLWLPGASLADGAAAVAAERGELLAEAGADVVALDYPLAPEHPFPAGLNAAYEALQALAAAPKRWSKSVHTALFVGGEEGGGNIAAALTLMSRDQQAPRLAGQLLLSPMLDPHLGSASMRESECGGSECIYAKGWKAYLGSCANADHPYAVPMHASRLSGLAPALVLSVAGHPLNDESRRYAAALRAHGGHAHDLTLDSLAPDQALNPIHDFLRDAARRALSLPD